MSLPNNGRLLLVDSGAFSAWNKNIKIDINVYADWCVSNLNNVDYFVNLDVIPGRPGVAPGRKEINEAALQGWANYEFMLRKGIPAEKLIHVFHQGEDWEWLEKMMQLPYIGLSPANDRALPHKEAWLDDCMKVACDSNGMPRNKWHGFAVTALPLMIKYPWYSVDSATWHRNAINGKVIYCNHKTQILDRAHPNDIFYTKSPTYMYDYIDSKLEEREVTWEGLMSEVPVYRMRYNIIEYQEYVDNVLPQWPWPYKQQKGLLF